MFNMVFHHLVYGAINPWIKQEVIHELVSIIMMIYLQMSEHGFKMARLIILHHKFIGQEH